MKKSSQRFIEVVSTNTRAPMVINVDHVVTVMRATGSTTSIKFVSGENFYVVGAYEDVIEKMMRVEE